MAEIKIDLDKIMKDAVAEATRAIGSRTKAGVEVKMQELFMSKSVQQFHKDRGKFTPDMGFAANAVATAV